MSRSVRPHEPNTTAIMVSPVYQAESDARAQAMEQEVSIRGKAPTEFGSNTRVWCAWHQWLCLRAGAGAGQDLGAGEGSEASSRGGGAGEEGQGE